MGAYTSAGRLHQSTNQPPLLCGNCQGRENHYKELGVPDTSHRFTQHQHDDRTSSNATLALPNHHILTIRLAVSLAQIIAFIPVLALPGSRRVSPSHETGRVCDPDSLFNYLVVHIIRLALDIPVELYLGQIGRAHV